jgi:hypothetical protein
MKALHLVGLCQKDPLDLSDNGKSGSSSTLARYSTTLPAWGSSVLRDYLEKPLSAFELRTT